MNASGVPPTDSATDVPSAAVAAGMADVAPASIFETVFEVAQVGIFCIDPSGRLAQVNPSCERMLGYPAGALRGQPYTVIAPDFIAPIADRFLAALLADSSKLGSQWRVRKRDGSLIDVAVNHRAHRDADGRSFAVVTFTDISAQLAAEAAVRADNEALEQRIAERTRALVESEAGYRRVLDNAHDAIFVTQEGAIRYANPRCSEIFGLPSTDLIGASSIGAVHPDDREQVLGVRRRLLAGERVQPYEARFMRRDGAVVWGEIFGVRIEWNGAPAVLVFVKNITERKRLEDELARNLAERNAILATSDAGMCLLRARRHTWVNQRICSMLGFAEHELLGQLTRIHYPDEAAYEAIGAAAYAAIERDGSWTGETRMRRKDGQLIWVLLHGRKVDYGDHDQTLWTYVDVTERRRLLDALAPSEHKYRQIVERASEGILVASPERGILYANPRALQINGLVPEDLPHTPLMELVHPDDREHVRAEMRKRIRGEAQGPIQLRARAHRPEREVWHELDGVPIEWEGQRAILMFANDITERRRMETEKQRVLERERELSELKSRFVAMASHEFKTPIAIIVSSADLLRHYADTLDASERERALTDIQDAAETMNRILEDVLMIGRADVDRHQPEPRQLDMPALAGEVAQRVSRADRERHPIRVDVAQTVAIRQASLDVQLLARILENLLTNACKYSPAGSPVDLVIDRVDGKARFRVRDRGIGIPSADQHRLFESFFRASNVGTIRGTGLGLSIVKRAVELQGGEVQVHSGDSGGSEFVVLLPLGH
jgi:PAS domain S-box-containing protein